jgi:hypothetical protein
MRSNMPESGICIGRKWKTPYSDGGKPITGCQRSFLTKHHVAVTHVIANATPV